MNIERQLDTQHQQENIGDDVQHALQLQRVGRLERGRATETERGTQNDVYRDAAGVISDLPAHDRRIGSKGAVPPSIEPSRAEMAAMKPPHIDKQCKPPTVPTS